MIIGTDISIPKEASIRLRELIEICDDELIVNRRLLEQGLLCEVQPGEFRYYPVMSDVDHIGLICIAKPIDEEGKCHPTKCILRLPAYTGEMGKRFMLGFIQYMCEAEGPGFLTLGATKRGGESN